MRELTPYPIAPQTGGSVAVADVIGRDDLIIRVLNLIRSGNSLILVDPRRMGKTSMLRRLANEPGPNTSAVMLSQEGVATDLAFFQNMVKALHDHKTLGQRFSKLLSHVTEIDVKAGKVATVKVKPAFGGIPPVELLAKVVDQIEAELDDEHLIVIMDEVPLAIRNITRSKAQGQGPETAGLIFQQLRALSERTGQVRFIVCGSIGFHHVLRDAGVTEGALNVFDPVPLGPLDVDGASFLAECLILGIGREIEADAVATVTALTGGIPFLIHHLAHALGSQAGAVSKVELTATWEEFILDRQRSQAMTHLESRIDDYPADLQAAAKFLLDAAALSEGETPHSRLSPPGCSADERGRVLNLLVDDHYLVEASGGVSWRYDVFRRIWIARRRLMTGGE